MQTERVKIRQVKTLAENPRTITRDKFRKLIDSILVFPKMLELRPIVVNSRMEALGGNMRVSALKEIAKMSITEIAGRLMATPDYNALSEGEQDALVKGWSQWLEQPTVPILNASHLTEAERKQFLIKDNVSYGTWDYDKLANEWDNRDLEAWGMDVWKGTPAAFAKQAEDEEAGEDFQSALPPELQGVDLNPNELPKIEGDDATPMEYLTITFDPGQRSDLANHFGISEDKLFNKIAWRLDELIQMRQEGANDESN